MVHIALLFLLSLTCVTQSSLKEGGASKGVIQSDDARFQGKPCVGVAEMSPNGVVTFRLNGELMWQRVKESDLEYRPGTSGYQWAVDYVGGMKPGERKPVPPFAESIGVASMESDGTLVLQLRMTSPDGAIGEGMLSLSPTDPRYKKAINHIGGIKPGEVKSIPPW